MDKGSILERARQLYFTADRALWRPYDLVFHLTHSACKQIAQEEMQRRFKAENDRDLQGYFFARETAVHADNLTSLYDVKVIQHADDDPFMQGTDLLLTTVDGLRI